MRATWGGEGKAMDMMQTLRDLMLTAAPSGYEKEMAYKMMDYLRPYCQEVRVDRVGNVISKIAGSGPSRPRAMVFGHMDQLGFIVRRIEPDGFLQVDRLGGIPEKVLPGLRLSVRSEDGRWHPGVFGSKSHHAASAKEKYEVDPVGGLLIDLGASSAEAVRRLGIHVGCPAVYRPAHEPLLSTRVAGTAIDNRGGCAALIAIAQRLCENPPACDVYLVATVWEEFNLRGAMMAARTVKPDLAIMLDVTLAGDTRDLASHFEDVLGGGPCVQLYSFHGRGTLNGTLPHEALFRLAKETAQAEGIALQRFAALGIVTDAAYVQLEQEGVACLEMGFPVRYTHTPVEVCDVRDIEGLALLVSAMMRRIDKDFQINRY